MAWQPDYITTAEFKDWARITDATDDTAIGLAISAASRVVDKFCSRRVPRQFGKVSSAEDRYYTPRWSRKDIKWVIEIDDLMDTAGLVVRVDTDDDGDYESAITDYVLRPQDAPQKSRPYTQIMVANDSSVQPTEFAYSAKVTAVWGWTAVPDEIKQATYMQTNRIHKRRSAPFGVAGGPTRGTQVTTNMINELDPEIETILSDFVKLGWTM